MLSRALVLAALVPLPVLLAYLAVTEADVTQVLQTIPQQVRDQLAEAFRWLGDLSND